MGVDTVGMTEAEGVRAAVDAVRKLSLSIGIPQKLHEINVKRKTCINWLLMPSMTFVRAVILVLLLSKILRLCIVKLLIII